MARASLMLAGALLLSGCVLDSDDENLNDVLVSYELDGSPEALPSDGSLDAHVSADSHDARSEVPGCHFYVDSLYRGHPLWMDRGTTIANLHAYGMGDKISSVRLLGGATARMWIHTDYRGGVWYISSDVPSLHDHQWGNLGDNSSSVDCY